MTFRPSPTRHPNKRVARYEKPLCWHKRRFKDKRQAESAIRNIQARDRDRGSKRDATPCRAYSCDLCGGSGWHITSQPQIGVEDTVVEERG